MQLGDQLTTTTEVGNWLGDPEGLTAPALMEQMQAHAERFRYRSIEQLKYTFNCLKFT